eukprot:TRINITY_DN554_c4_g1_i1.p1 TRINITY_DN554_c4_g1~~TRINITY_DN554_c4_g1_i1.p1  ORF type:complete len:394 (+),score=55.71 TRINITY_DN554_c4_g1_i1:44-1225(+)
MEGKSAHHLDVLRGVSLAHYGKQSMALRCKRLASGMFWSAPVASGRSMSTDFGPQDFVRLNHILAAILALFRSRCPALAIELLEHLIGGQLGDVELPVGSTDLKQELFRFQETKNFSPDDSRALLEAFASTSSASRIRPLDKRFQGFRRASASDSPGHLSDSEPGNRGLAQAYQEEEASRIKAMTDDVFNALNGESAEHDSTRPNSSPAGPLFFNGVEAAAHAIAAPQRPEGNFQGPRARRNPPPLASHSAPVTRRPEAPVAFAPSAPSTPPPDQARAVHGIRPATLPGGFARETLLNAAAAAAAAVSAQALATNAAPAATDGAAPQPAQAEGTEPAAQPAPAAGRRRARPRDRDAAVTPLIGIRRTVGQPSRGSILEQVTDQARDRGCDATS